jgi:hypothetical protein
LYFSGEVSREHCQSLKADYEEVKVSKFEALKALEEDAKDQRVVLDEALVILGEERWSIAFLTTPSTRFSNSRRGVRIVFGYVAPGGH